MSGKSTLYPASMCKTARNSKPNHRHVTDTQRKHIQACSGTNKCFLGNVFKQKMCNFDSRKIKSEEKKDKCINDYI